MQTVSYDMKCKAGTTFRKIFTFKDSNENLIDFTGYSARMQLRTSYDASTPTLELTSDNDGIVIDGTAGTVALFISDQDTSSLAPDFIKINYVYDLELIAPNEDVLSPIYGKFTVSPEVTR